MIPGSNKLLFENLQKQSKYQQIPKSPAEFACKYTRRAVIINLRSPVALNE
jgi:hypothetical protein